MDFTYEASGGVEVFGCSGYELIYFRYYKYRVGSILFSKDKANIGIYEKIAIKDVRFPTPFVNLYVDTFNGLWNEDELIPYETAQPLVKQYIEKRNADAENATKLCRNTWQTNLQSN